MQTSYTKNLNVTTQTFQSKPNLWDEKYIIENLPPWVYQDNPEPKSLKECEATICRLEHTIEDIELQIKIREFEMETGTGRQQSKHEHDKWVVQALRAKQTHKYLLSAYKYWKIINDKAVHNKSNTLRSAAIICGYLSTLCALLKDDPPTFEDELDALKKAIETYSAVLDVD